MGLEIGKWSLGNIGPGEHRYGLCKPRHALGGEHRTFIPNPKKCVESGEHGTWGTKNLGNIGRIPH